MGGDPSEDKDRSGRGRGAHPADGAYDDRAYDGGAWWLSASRLEISLPIDFDVAACDGPIVRLWPDAGPKEEFGLPIEPGHTMTVHVVDLDGTPQAIVAVRKESSSAADVAELEEVIASIRFE